MKKVGEQFEIEFPGKIIIAFNDSEPILLSRKKIWKRFKFVQTLQGTNRQITSKT